MPVEFGGFKNSRKLRPGNGEGGRGQIPDLCDLTLREIRQN
jgi:hypothetical protein